MGTRDDGSDDKRLLEIPYPVRERSPEKRDAKAVDSKAVDTAIEVVSGEHVQLSPAEARYIR